MRRTGGRAVAAGPDGAAAVARADLVLDGVVGASGRGPLRPAAAELVGVADSGSVPVLAVDSPSGVDPDTGTVDGPAVTAVATVTFGALKPVHVLAAHRCGSVELVDIGLGPELPDPYAVALGEADVATRWPVPGLADDKYTQGVTGIAAGSATYPGAAVLARGAAVLCDQRYGALQRISGRSRPGRAVAGGRHRRVRRTPRTQSWAVGPGIGTDDAGWALLAAALDRDVPLRIDADGVTLLGGHADLRSAIAGRPGGALPARPGVRPGRRRGGIGPHRGSPSGGGGATGDGATQGQRHRRRRPDGRTLVHPSTTSWWPRRIG